MTTISGWLTDNYIELFGAITGIIYVFLEIRQTIWLWPVGIITSAVYIWVFFTSKFYADMSLQVYYLGISILGWYWWARGSGLRAPASTKVSAGKAGHTVSSEALAKEEGSGQAKDGSAFAEASADKRRKGEGEKGGLEVTRLNLRTGIILTVVFVFLYAAMWLVLSKLTDSPVPGWDSFITSLSVVATWMLARKIYEHWFLWIVVNSVSAVLFMSRGLYPTVILYLVYGLMSFTGLVVWKKAILLSHDP
jgi:nicotinamide mononucleotide transporter